MNLYGVYDVIGKREYRGHAPGTRFEAILDPAAEQRAIARRDIRLVRRIEPSLVPGSYRLPDGWLDEPEQQTNGAPTGALLIEGGGK